MSADIKLTIELVPRQAWGRNLRRILSPVQWDSLRRHIYRKVGYKCEVCGGAGRNHPVECHEKWAYDDDKHTAKLVGLYGLCPECHECKHIGLAQKNGRIPEAIAHLAIVNNISKKQANKLVEDAFRLWQKRSRHSWTIDITWAQEQLATL